MKLYMKQKVFSWGDKFTVKDANGADRYYVQGEVFTFGKKLHIYDMLGNEVAFVKQEVFSWLPRYYVFRNQRQVAEIKKEFTMFLPKYTIAGLGWEVEGHFMEHDYQIIENGRPIVSIAKAWLSWGDSYELDIAPSCDEVSALAVVLAVDCVLDSRSSGTSIRLKL